MNFTHDWFTPHSETMWEVIRKLTPVSILDIGCYEGRSTVWFAEKYPGTKVTAVDTFEGSQEHRELGIDFSGVMRRFIENTQGRNVELFVGSSVEFFRQNQERFDLIHLDGSHTAMDVLMDCAMGWACLNPGGFMVVDDYAWDRNADPALNPRMGVDFFMKANNLHPVSLEYRAIFQKTT